MRIMTERLAEQLIKMLADNRVHPDQWRFWIPQHITEENLHIVANAKMLADGINESIAENSIGIPEPLYLKFNSGQEVDR